MRTLANFLEPNDHDIVYAKLSEIKLDEKSKPTRSWMINSVPFKTLHGALKMGLKSFFPTDKVKFKQLEYYFGNIDIRHHLMRQDYPEQATRLLVQDYFSEAKKIAGETGAEIKIYEPLPIENERRHIPKTGWYEKTPFYGSWEHRDTIRNVFIDQAIKEQGNGVTFFRWCEKLKNNIGELDFKYMEKPQSVHLSREHYPHWQGWELNGLAPPVERINKPVNVINATLRSFL